MLAGMARDEGPNTTRDEPAGARAAPRFIPEKYTPKIAAWFRRYARRKIDKSFFAVRLARGSFDPRSVEPTRPLVIALTHASWWDPLLSMALQDRWAPTRRPMGPMEADQLERFGIFRRVGIFGVEPNDPASLEAMRAHVLRVFEAEAPAVLWLTPQGSFADPRAPLVVRPGMAAIAAGQADPGVVCVAVEYAFWVDQKPEIFLSVREARLNGAEASTTAWQRAIVAAFEDARADVARRVIDRDPDAFEIIMGKGVAKTNIVWDLIMRLRGQSGSIEPRRGAPRRERAESGDRP